MLPRCHCPCGIKFWTSLLWLSLGTGMLHQLHTAAACSVQTPTYGSNLHVWVAPGPAIGCLLCSTMYPLCCMGTTLGGCWVCVSMAVSGSHFQLKKGCSFDITIPCKSSIRHLAFLCSRQTQLCTPQCQSQHNCSVSHTCTLVCAGSLRIASEDMEIQV